MDIEKYLNDLVNKYKYSNVSPDETVIKEITKLISSFDKRNIDKISVFGSSLKKTNIRPSTQIKLLVSIKERDKRSIEELIFSYKNFIQYLNLAVIRKNNQLLFTYNEIDFILFISKKIEKTYNFHVMYNLTTSKEISTNFNIHTSTIIESNCNKEILLMKLWREKHQLNFPTIYLELVVLKALQNCQKKNLFSRMLRILDFLRKDFINEKFYDLSNTNNIISDYLSHDEKLKIQLNARICMTHEYISDIIS